MNRIVLDASVTLSWCFPNEQTQTSVNVLDRLSGGEHAIVPAFWALEVLNSLLVGERKGRMPNPGMDYLSLDQIAGR